MILKIIIIILLIALIFCIAIFVEGNRECKQLKLTEYCVSVNNLPRSFEDYKILFLSDLHNTIYEHENEFVFRLIEEKKPDIIVLGGDMIVCRPNQEQNNRNTARFIQRLSEKLPVYYAMGNHESGVALNRHDTEGAWEEYLNDLDLKSYPNIHFMRNEICEIKKNEDAIRIIGFELKGKYYRRFIAKKLTVQMMKEWVGNSKKDKCNVLIAHHPDYFSVYEQWGADLCLSGHNHGGLVRLPFLGGVISPRLHIFPKYDKGLFFKNDAVMVLSGGMGQHSMKLRVNNFPECVMIILKKH